MNILVKIFFVMLLCSYCYNLSGQVSLEWKRNFSGLSGLNDGATSIVVDNEQNIYVGGTVNSYTHDSVCIIKYNYNGVVLWQKYFRDHETSACRLDKIMIDNNGDLILNGYSFNGTIFIAKLDSSGNVLWKNRFLGGSMDVLKPLAIDPFGNILITFYIGSGAFTKDIAAVKLGSNGVLLWSKYFNGPISRDDEPRSIITDENGNVYITGFMGVGISSTGVTIEHYCTLKYSANGLLEWMREYPDSNIYGSRAYAIAVDNFDDVYVSGGAGVLKYNSDGTRYWIKPAANSVYSLLAINSKNELIASGSSGPSYHYATAKFDPNGNINWFLITHPAGSVQDYNMSMKLDRLDNVYLTGRSYFGNNSDAVTIKINDFGLLSWMQTYDGVENSHDGSNDIAIDSSYNVYICGGESFGQIPRSDFLTIKYSQTIGLIGFFEEVPTRYILSQNYPNPFNPVTKIKFSIPSVGKGRDRSIMKIYNSLGHEVQVLVNQSLQPGIYEVDWDASNFPSGVYFYELTSGDFIQTKKMVLIK